MNNVNQAVVNKTTIREEGSVLRNAFTISVVPSLVSFADKAYKVVSGEVVKKAAAAGGGYDLVGLLKNTAIGFFKSAYSLAVAHPVITTSLVLATIVIPIIREYCAKNEKFTLLAPFVMAWMLVSRPFRLIYRLVKAISGGAEVEKQKLLQVAKRLGPLFRENLARKKQAATRAIEIVSDDRLARLLGDVFVGIYRNTDKIVQKGSFGDYKTDWEFLQKILRDEANVRGVDVVRTALDEWKKCLGLVIATK
ncbi:MAG: hypothetical protein LBB17_02325 [Puniceicoccales bacterium]|nr:hypothetical protein [Puniceicoccales bacterium]